MDLFLDHEVSNFSFFVGTSRNHNGKKYKAPNHLFRDRIEFFFLQKVQICKKYNTCKIEEADWETRDTGDTESLDECVK